MSMVASEEKKLDIPPNVTVLDCTRQILELHTIIRDRTTDRNDFIFYSDRLIRLLVEEGLNLLPFEEKSVETPTGCQYEGVDFTGRLCGVSIMRAGEAMERGLRTCCRSVRIGKILIQREGIQREPKLYYAKFPPDVDNRHVLLMDPLLASGGTVLKAIQVLKEHGCEEDQISFLNLIASRVGIANVHRVYPGVRIVTTAIDEGLDREGYIVPGIGDFAERYFGTDDTATD
eukprot:Nk52_evm43s210 gene=Nk52_evmTU43s210